MLTLLKPETSIGGSDVYDAIKPVVKQFQRTLSEQQIVILLQQRNQQGVSALYDIWNIPLHREHALNVTSNTPAKLILMRKKAG